ncbi:hypothetical protein [Chryseobacterium shigense]|uniref:hypothetical protein n=1 Tax=Chryseobacterium shigense TaxID=297244 RepID=UPI0013FE1FC9|nr:hypothetical protein [Chryseobacterium shigense]
MPPAKSNWITLERNKMKSEVEDKARRSVLLSPKTCRITRIMIQPADANGL